jgi:histidine ammonia-lyase
MDSTDRIQDAYCMRCIPQVLGPVKDTIAFARGYVERTLNASIDNPLILESDGKESHVCVSGGNFHGEGLAFMLDFLSIAMSEVANISERRLFTLLTPALNYGLPSMLIPSSGLNTGLMVAQYTAAALVSDNKTLAHPDSVDSIPTSADQEDHVSMGANGARHLWEILENVTHVVAIEFLCAAQAVDLRDDGPRRLGEGTRIAHGIVRKMVKFYDNDREMTPDISRLAELIEQEEIITAVDGVLKI